ncbi:MAG: hypothetical protein ACFCU4_03645 [Puniceicoccaceae bacterium]
MEEVSKEVSQTETVKGLSEQATGAVDALKSEAANFGDLGGLQDSLKKAVGSLEGADFADRIAVTSQLGDLATKGSSMLNNIMSLADKLPAGVKSKVMELVPSLLSKFGDLQGLIGQVPNLAEGAWPDLKAKLLEQGGSLVSGLGNLKDLL